MADFTEPRCERVDDAGRGCILPYGHNMGRADILENHRFENPRTREAVNHPSHYGGDTTYEAIKVIEAWELGFCLGNTVKYISRAGKKDPSATVEDLRKARWYLDREIARLDPGSGEKKIDYGRASAEAAWNEGFEASSEWMANNPGPSGIPHDPPRNPYEMGPR